MMISTKGRYALRIMTELAAAEGRGFGTSERCGAQTRNF